MGSRRWADLSGVERVLVVVAAVFQIALLGAALWDLRGRDASRVRGPKRLWYGVVFVNWVGPISYFTVGRKD
jgi:hypothetical protein